MSQEFVQTQVTLLQRIAMEKTGEDEATWAWFFELTPYDQGRCQYP